MSYGRWDDAFLESMRQVGDPLADEVMTAVIHKHEIEMVNQIFRSLVDNDDIVADDMPPEVNAYLQETAVLPDWADMALIEQGAGILQLALAQYRHPALLRFPAQRLRRLARRAGAASDHAPDEAHAPPHL